jgi:hypothetical protein
MNPYTILSFLSPNGGWVEQRTPDALWTQKPQNDYYLDRGYLINAIRRECDGEVFKLYDKVKGPLGKSRIIEFEPNEMWEFGLRVRIETGKRDNDGLSLSTIKKRRLFL